jgi:hypothetical protein
MTWFYTSTGVQLGPISEDALRALAASGRLLPTDLVWREGMPAWQPAASIPGLMSSAPPGSPLPPPLPASASFPPPPPLSTEDDPALRWVLPVGRSGWAIAAGYLGLLSLVGIFAPFAVITGILALREIKRHPHLGGRGRAIFGIVMGGLVTLGLIVALAVPAFSR